MKDDKNDWILLIAIGLVLLFTVSCIPKDDPEIAELKHFASYEELESFLDKNLQSGGYAYYGGEMMMRTGDVAMATFAEAAPAAGSVQKASDYSTTNIQVEGVDEADIVKSDGTYLYIVAGQKVVIVEAYPADDMDILSTIEFDFSPQEVFINNDKLVVLGNDYREYVVDDLDDDPRMATGKMAADMYYPRPYRTVQVARILVYDVADRSNPETVRDVTADGYYFDSRMIGEHVYVIATQNVWRYNDQPVPLPMLVEDGVEREIAADEIAYFPVPDTSYSFTNILTIDLEDDNEPSNTNVYMMGSAQNMYVSQDNIYVVYQRYLPHYYYEEQMIDVLLDILPVSIRAQVGSVDSDLGLWERYQEKTDIIEEHVNSLDADEQEEFGELAEQKMEEVMQRIAKEQEQTHIHRIAISDGEVEYAGKGRVPGRVLNQFSMDEYDGYFRIATTTGQVSRGGGASANHIYVLDDELDIVGSVEDLAPGERIYSARFMGERAYMVTFKKVDPLFVIDLSDPYNPSVLGKLKIPGYSDYLHPYDENHIIGIGKEAVEAEEGDFAWYQGVKISLFDVSDVSKPKEISKVEIGDRGTDSDALHDHKAFLFSRSKNLLVIPIRLAEIDEEKYPQGLRANTYGDFTFQGVYVYNLDLENGFQFKGRITHLENADELEKLGHYWYGYGSESVKRSLYMDDVLYTVSESAVKANSLDDLEHISTVKLPLTDNGVYPEVIY